MINMVFLTPLDFKINNTRARVHFLRSYLLSPPEYLKFINSLNDIYTKYGRTFYVRTLHFYDIHSTPLLNNSYK